MFPQENDTVAKFLQLLHAPVTSNMWSRVSDIIVTDFYVRYRHAHTVGVYNATFIRLPGADVLS